MPVHGVTLDAPADLARLLDPYVKATPDAVAVRTPDGVVTWSELDAAGQHLARHYVGLGLAPGDRVA